MKRIGLTVIASILASVAYAITTNPASNVTADSDNTAFTIPYRDSSGNFVAGTISAKISASSSTTSGFTITLEGAYTTAQIQAKTPTAAGQLVYNSTLANVCVSTGATIQGYKLVGTASTACQ
jgi:hypothetical protein